MRTTSKFIGRLAASVALSAIVPGVAFAQDAADAEQEAAVDPEIVVTGTLVRGIAPPGASVLSTSQKDIEASGATSVAQVLQTIPQLGSFGTLQQPLAASGEVSVNRPNLRSLPGFNTSGGSSTLVLMDGHRLVGMGVSSTSPDPDFIPAGVLERVEIVPDGGSALYGSDAVAGVMNFITIKRFDGIKVDGSYGFADNYYQYDGNVTAGKDWGSGSIFVSYAYAKTDELLGKDRDYVREFPQNINGNGLGYTSLSCGAGAVQDLLPFPNGTPLPGTGIIAGLPDVRAVNGVRPVPNQSCDASDYATVFPSSRRHSVFAGLTQQLDDTFSVDIRAHYTNRKTHVQNGPFQLSQIVGTTGTIGGSGDVTAVTSSFSNANTIVNAPAFGQFIQRVYFPIGGNDASRSDIELDTWGVSPTFTKDIDGNFRVRLMGTYGQSTASLISTAINNKGLQSAIRGGLINPYNLADRSGTAANADQVLAAITNFETYAMTRQRMTNARAIVDGDLFTLPGGAVKIAAGVEYSNERFIAQTGQTIPGFENTGAPVVSVSGRPIIFDGASNYGNPGNNTASAAGPINLANVMPIAPLARFNLGRSVKSAFGELVVPIFGAENGGPGYQQLTVSVSGRYDDYSDFGSTFNPRFGFTYKPVDWVSIHGAFGKSFNAPSLADDERASLDTLFVLSGGGASFFTNAATANGGYPALRAANNIVALRGNKPGITPQKAKTYSLGIDIEPPFVEGLRLSATYYRIDFKDFIGLAAFENPPVLFRDFRPIITTYNDLSPAAFQALLDSAFAQADIVNNGQTTAPAAATTYAFFDARKQNIGDTKTAGVDMSVSYRHETGFGSVFFNTNGTYVLDDKLRLNGATSYRERVGTNQSRFKLRSMVGADIGALTAQITWNHRQGYDLSSPVGYAGTSALGQTFVAQTKVDSFDFFDLFFKLDVPGDSVITRDLSFTLNVNNVFDQDPPEYRGTNNIAGRLGYDNGATLGRLVQFGVSKKF